MRGNHKIRSCFRVGVLTAILAAATAPMLLAQSTTAPSWSVVTFTTVKPEMRSQYEAWQKEMTAAFKKAEIPSRAVLDTVMGDLFEYVTIYPVARFADLDGPSPMERALGKEGAASLIQKGMPYLTSAHRVATLASDDLSIQTKTQSPAPYAMVTIVRLAAGKGPEFETWMKDDYLPAMKKAEVKNYWVSQTVFGGDPNERVGVRPMEKLGEIDAGPLTTKALGKEGARQLISKTAGIVESVQYRIVHYRADLSYDMRQQGEKSASAK
jgi:hypothetical protein